MIRKILVSAICTVAVLFCMSCAGTAGGGADDNVGYLVFSGSSRSLPAGKTYNDLSSIELYGSYRGGSEKKLASWSTGSELNNSQVEVKVGRWEFRMSANLGNKIYEKSISMDIKADADNVAAFNMQFVGQPVNTLGVGDIILKNGYGATLADYPDVSGVATGIAVVGYKSGNTVYAVGKTPVSQTFTWNNAITAATGYNPETGSTSGASSGWVLPDKDVLKNILAQKNIWNPSLVNAIGGGAPGSILWSASEALSDGTRGVKIDSSAAEQNEYKTIQHNICPVKIY